MEYLGHGRMRHAFKFGNKVLKIPRNFSGIKACFEELILWNKFHSPAMAPISFAIPGLCIVMPYYGEKWNEPNPSSFVKLLNEFGIVDLNPYNIRKFNGNPIAIGYAVNYNSSGQGEPTDGW